MTAAESMSVRDEAIPLRRHAVAAADLTVQSLLENLGGRYLEMVSAPEGLERRICRVVIWDVASPVSLKADDLILAVGVLASLPSLPTLIDAAAKAGATAVAVKGLSQDSWARAMAERAGITMLSVPRELAWDELASIVRNSLAAVSWHVDSSELPVGDLFALANAAAANLGGPVEIDDARMGLLAFSNLAGEVDDLRRASILARSAPAEFVDWLRAQGILRQLRDTGLPVKFHPPGQRPRLVAPIRAGIDILGYIWVAEGEQPLDAQQELDLVEIARIASVQLIRLRGSDDSEGRLRGDCLRSVLEGTGSAEMLAARLGVGLEQKLQLLAMRPRAGWVRGRTERALVEDLVALRVGIAVQDGVAIASNEAVYAALPAEMTPHEVRSLASELRKIAANQLQVDLVVAIGGIVPALGELSRARTELDRVLRILLEMPSSTIATSEELRPQTVIAELCEIARRRPELLQGRIAVLREIDVAKKTQYLETLQAFFDAACDLTEASKLLYIHRNTLRYRLRRIHELSGLDLEDPAERLVAELQLRLIARVETNVPHGRAS
jgi:DNA-binding PucR family transcriptional regulator